MFLFSFLVLDTGAGDFEWRDWIVVVLEADVELYPRVGVEHFFNVGRRRDVVGVADVHYVVRESEHFHEVEELLRARELHVVVVADVHYVVHDNEHLDEVDDILRAVELLVRELWLHTAGLATKVGGIAEVVGVAGRTTDINLQLADLGVKVRQLATCLQVGQLVLRVSNHLLAILCVLGGTVSLRWNLKSVFWI